MSDQTPWLSIVTVVKDDLEGFVRTRDSISMQDTTGVQWVVIDSSRDADAVRRNAHEAALNVTYQWTAPQGIYPAMNAALDLATGTYIWFVNAGDEVAGTSTTQHLQPLLTSQHPQWLIGQVSFVDARGHRTTPPPFDYARERCRMFAGDRFAPHQGTIVRTQWLRQHGGFDTRYRMAADYELSLRLALESDPVITRAVICDFHLGGASSQHWALAASEFHQARRRVFAPTGLPWARESALTGVSYARAALGALLRRTRRST